MDGTLILRTEPRVGSAVLNVTDGLARRRRPRDRTRRATRAVRVLDDRGADGPFDDEAKERSVQLSLAKLRSRLRTR